MDEYAIGGLAACGAGFFTNPLEVAKTRQQLQGELAAFGNYQRHYKNVVHTFYKIGRVEGIAALQKGLVPALYYQFSMNGVRLGTFQWLVDKGLTKDSQGRVSLWRSALAGSAAGGMGAFFASPFYLVSTFLNKILHPSLVLYVNNFVLG